MDPNIKKWLSATVLLSLVVAAVLVNYQWVQQPKLSQDQRELASAAQGSSHTQWEDWLSQRLEASEEDRAIASIGESPGLTKDFALGYLGGKYRVKLNEGRLVHAEFFDTDNDRPKYIGDRTEFLQKNYMLFIDDLKQVELESESRTDLGVVETYHLYGPNGGRRVDISLDTNGRLLGIVAH